MKKKNAGICAAVLALCLLFASCGTQTESSNTDKTVSGNVTAAPDTDAPTNAELSAWDQSPYRVILDAYQEGIRSGYTPTEAYPEDGYVGNIVYGYKVTDLYYALIDLCGDGQPELFIAGTDADEMNTENMRLYDAWGCADGKPARLFDANLGWRGSFTIHKDGTILYDSEAIRGEYVLFTVEKDGASVSGKGISMDMGEAYYSHEYWAFNDPRETETISRSAYDAFYNEMEQYEPMTDIQWIALG